MSEAMRFAVWNGSGEIYDHGKLILDEWTCSNCGRVIQAEDPKQLPGRCPGCRRFMEVANETD